ncbi:hypothetical protein AMTRI_Chr07g24410 [Amborella trichopoda]
MEDWSKYAHSPAHLAVVRQDHAALRCLLSSLPRLPRPGEVTTEAESINAESIADSLSSVIDRRDVPFRETPLHLAVRLKDPISADLLLSAGADWSLQNASGWSALQEAVCSRQEGIAASIARHYQPLAWAKWTRRLPRIVGALSRMPDFYMEISFHFESSVIPFISRIAPSDTYRVWKRGASLRADTTLAGFDGFRIHRSDQSFLFLGDPKIDGFDPGSLLVLSHKEKEVHDALEGAGSAPSEAEVAHEVALMSQTNMYRPGIDVTQAELLPHLNWRRQERAEMVGPWKAKVYDMLNVMVSVKSRRVPGAMTDEELFVAEEEKRNSNGGEGYEDVLTPEEKSQLDSALKMGNSDGFEEEGLDSGGGVSSNGSNGIVKEKKAWFGWNGKKGSGVKGEENCGGGDEGKILKKFSKLGPEGSGGHSNGSLDRGSGEFGKEKESKKKKKKGGGLGNEPKNESEYKKGLKPVLWLTQDFPLKTEELLPLLDILANKVKAVRRLRELLTTKLPTGTFPVKVAIPIVPTIRVLVTFTKFEDFQPSEKFSTPLSSPAYFQDTKAKDTEVSGTSSGSWVSWMRGSRGQSSEAQSSESHLRDDSDPFHIPSDYTWVDANEKKRRMKAKKAKNKKGKKQAARNNLEGQHLSEPDE